MHTPLYDMLCGYSKQAKIRFCMPGHKGRLDKLDITEMGEMDLKSPKGALLEAQQLAAQAFGAEYARFSVNGSTAGVIALVLAAAKPGKKILIPRDCHISVASSLIIGGQKPVYIGFRESGIPLPPSVEDIETALNNHPDIKAVLITSPNYYGVVADIAGISRLCRKRNIPLIVDCAHGAHYAFCTYLPSPPFEADGWVVSAHKTLDALNQTAIVCIGKDSMICPDSVFGILNLVQTSSPYWPALASIDTARADMQANGQQKWSELIERINSFYGMLNSNVTPVKHIEGYAKDPTRIVLDIGDGFSASRKLFAKGISIEMADSRHIVLISTSNDTVEQFCITAAAINELGKHEPVTAPSYPVWESSELTPREAAYSDYIWTKDCIGRISCACVACYPPGTAVIMPGDIITEQQLNYLNLLNKMGATITGAKYIDGLLHFKVIK